MNLVSNQFEQITCEPGRKHALAGFMIAISKEDTMYSAGTGSKKTERGKQLHSIVSKRSLFLKTAMLAKHWLDQSVLKL